VQRAFLEENQMKANCAFSAFTDTTPEHGMSTPMFSLLIRFTDSCPEFIPICNSDKEEKKIHGIIERIKEVLKNE